MKIITQKEIENNEYAELRKAAEELGVESKSVSSKEIPTIFGKDKSRFFFGSVEFLNLVDGFIEAAHLGLKSNNEIGGYSHKFDNFLCSNYYPYYYKYLFNKDHCYVTAGTIVDQQFDLAKQFGKDTKIFIRPNSGAKLFTGGIFDILDLEKEFDELNLKPEELLVVSSPKEIAWEGRFFCKGDEIITYSTYQLQGNITKIPSVPEGSLRMAQEVVDYFPFFDKYYTVDICSPDLKSFYLLEFNGFFSSGLYECDKKKIVEALIEG